jgi:hypothetical protein
MKSHIYLLFFITILSCNSNTKTNSKFTPDVSTNRIEVLDFYGKHRCASCIAIEKNTNEILSTYFPEELKNNQIIFKLIQWDDPKNEAITNKFMAAGTSLIIYRIKDGKEYIEDITEFAFTNASNKASFTKGLKEKLAENLALQK